MENMKERITALTLSAMSLRFARSPTRGRLRFIVWESSTRADRIER